MLNKYLKCSVWRLALRYDICMSLGFKRLITNLMHWLLFVHKILFSSTCFEPQVPIFRRIQLYTCSIWYCHSRGELSYLAPLGSHNISAPYFKQCFFQGGLLPFQTVKYHASQSQDRNNKYFILYIEFCINKNFKM